MIYLIGSGLIPEHLSVKGLNALRDCDEAYLEKYTSAFSSIEKDLEELIGKPLMPVFREDVEQNSDFFFKEGKEKNIAIVVIGDPLTATTHASFLLDAKRQGVSVEIIPGISVYSVAPGTAGLQVYKFGRSTTIVYPEENYYPESFYDVIRENQERKLHTLCFLDVKVLKNGQPKLMTGREAGKVLLDIARKRNDSSIQGLDCVVLCALGSETEKVYHCKVKDLPKLENSSSPQTLIVCAGLHDLEREYLQEFSEKV